MPLPSNLEQHFSCLRTRDFPSLNESSIYLDSAATSLKPSPVIEALSHFYLHEYGTVHRAIYSRASRATDLYNKVRMQLAHFLGAIDPSEIIFTRGTTDGINIVADSIACSGYLNEKKSILISEMEHHSNIVPWQIAAERTGAKLIVTPLLDGSLLDLSFLEKILIEEDVAVVSLTHCSNILGTINPIQEIAAMIRKYRGDSTLFCIDGAQSAPHMRLNLPNLDADFYLFSSHKMSGPTGVGALWGKRSILESLKPSRGGGDMIDKVTFEKTTYAPPPLRFEPGTPPIGEVIGFGRALSYLENECSGMEAIYAWESELLLYLQSRLQELAPQVKLIGNSKLPRGALQSFSVLGTHPLDVATLLDLHGIAIRSGHLCGQPLLAKLNLSSVLRASISYYNTKNDIDLFITALKATIKMLLH
ncbi:MAG: aminotransferase class V-fold PLP-dependent enzyme [Chlamydia sp.]